MNDDTTNAPAAPAVGALLDRGVGRLVERLRALARREHDDLSIGDEAADELESMARLVSGLVAWQQEGELLLNKPGISAAFSLGRWWADRPWRKRPNAKLTG